MAEKVASSNTRDAGAQTGIIARLLRTPGGISLFVALNIANVSNYLFQVIMGRALGPASYGLLGSLIALVNVLVVSFTSLQTASAKTIAVNIHDRIPLRHVWDDPLTRVAAVGGVAITAALVLLSPLIAKYLHSDLGPALIPALVVIPAAMLALGQGRLQGLSAFRAFAILAVLAAGLRLFLGPIAVYAGGGVTGAGIAVALATATAATWGLINTKRAGTVDASAVRRDLGRGALAFVVFWLMVSADIVVAVHYLPKGMAGQYAAASVVGKAVIWLPSAVVIAIYPQFARDRASGDSASGLLKGGMMVSLGLAGIAVLGLFVLGPTVIPTFFGKPKFDPAGSLAWKVGLACVPFAISYLLIYYHLAADQTRLIVAICAAAIGETIALAFLHNSANEIAVGLGIGGMLLCAGLLGLAVVPASPRRTIVPVPG